jgi:tetratricopeptide (TPR) repeat protein
MVKEEAELRKAIRLSPSSAAAYSWLGLMFAFNNRTEEALELGRKATQIERPSANAQTNVAWVYFAQRRLMGARGVSPRAPHRPQRSLPSLGDRHQLLAAPEALPRRSRRWKKAIEVTKGRQSHYVALLGGAYAAAGKTKEALDLLDELNRRSATEYIAPSTSRSSTSQWGMPTPRSTAW